MPPPKTFRYRLALTALAGVLATLISLGRLESWLLPGMHSDGVEYLSAAASLALEGRLSIPVTDWSRSDSTAILSHYPPGFSALLALPIGLAGIRPDVSATWLLALGAGLSTATVFHLAVTLGGWVAGVLALVLLGTNYTWNLLFLAVWSEPLYLPICLIGLWLVVARPGRPLLHGTVALAGTVLRFVGLAGAATAALAAWLHGRTLRERVSGLTLAGAPCVLFYVGWSGYVASNGESVRSFAILPGSWAQLRTLPRPVTEWFVPRTMSQHAPAAILLCTLAALLGGAAWIATRRARPAALPPPPGEIELRSRAGRIASTFAVLYLGLVVLSRGIADPLIRYDARTFAPVLVLLTLAIAIGVARVLVHGGWTARVLAGATIAAWAGFGAADIRVLQSYYAARGLYYTDQVWITDPALDWVRTAGAEERWIYADEPHVIAFHAGRSAKQLPEFADDIDGFVAAYADRPGPLVFVAPYRPVEWPEQDLVDRLPVEKHLSTAQVTVYLPTATRRGS